ncbi:glutathione s-transferase [Planoprotostelium fungivorum]|uniref:Glutathione s-transferase n=1 Tax=Planoprotostelium fungivorum TaxID=1890364 RepID=A0A2P6NVV1_9EUKA|nr:glutathione s-transferase [Planoprotostelium fungivorum]
MSGKPTLTYFNSRGRAEVARLVLTEAGIEWNDDRVDKIDDLKASGKLAFNQVPLLTYPDGFTLVQSTAIVRHLAREHGLYGMNNREAALADAVAEGVVDLLNQARPAIMDESLRGKLLDEILPKWLGLFEKWLLKNESAFFVGRDLTYADLVVFNLFDNMKMTVPGASLEGFPLCQKHFEMIANRPKIAAYLQTRPKTAR